MRTWWSRYALQEEPCRRLQLPRRAADSQLTGAVSYININVNMAHVEQQRRDGRVTLQVDQAQAVGQVTLSGSHEKQPARRGESRVRGGAAAKAERRSSVPGYREAAMMEALSPP